MKTHVFTQARMTTRRLGLAVVLTAAIVSSGCTPPTPTPPESALAGMWALVTSRIDTQLEQLSIFVDDNGFPTSVTYQLGSTPTATLLALGTTGLNGGLAGVTCFFGDNTFSIDGSLDAVQKNLYGFVTMRVRAESVTIATTRASGTLTRTTTPTAAQNVLAGTWTLSFANTQLYQTVLEFNSVGAIARVTTQIGTNPARTDITPAGTTSVTTDGVTIDVSTFGAGTARDTISFSGQLSADGDLLDGTVSLQISAGQTSVIVVAAPATLAKLTPPPSGNAALEGTWTYQAFFPATAGAGPTLTQLTLQFDSASLLTLLTYQVDNGSPVTIPGTATRTDFDGGLVTIRSTSPTDFFLFSGAVSSDEATMLGYMTAQLGGATVTQQPTVFVKQ